jgi:hypothetical protein
LKEKIFIPEVYVYDLLKYESPEVLKKSESLTMSTTSNLRLFHFNIATNQILKVDFLDFLIGFNLLGQEAFLD